MPEVPAPEVDRLMEEIAKIKNYLFCRLVLGNPILLPAAMKAGSLEEFLKDAEVKAQDLRDLCLKLEQPQLQEIRDACADFFRTAVGNGEASAGESEDEDSSEDEVLLPLKKRRVKHHLPEMWQSKREMAIKSAKKEDRVEMVEMMRRMNVAGEVPGSRIDFETIDDTGKFKKADMRVKICGRYIYNYPSESPSNRGGGLHFSIIARDCSLYKAVELRKSWDEFYELSLLTLYSYFPSPEWLLWVGGPFRRQYLR